jgi:hypothetical protein
MSYKNSTIATLDYIAVIKYGVPEIDGFFGATETVQELILKDYSRDKPAWRQKATKTSSFETNLEKYKDFI